MGFDLHALSMHLNKLVCTYFWFFLSENKYIIISKFFLPIHQIIILILVNIGGFNNVKEVNESPIDIDLCLNLIILKKISHEFKKT